MEASSHKFFDAPICAPATIWLLEDRTGRHYIKNASRDSVVFQIISATLDGIGRRWKECLVAPSATAPTDRTELMTTRPHIPPLKRGLMGASSAQC